MRDSLGWLKRPDLRALALEEQHANVMIADDKLNIVHANKAVIALLREVEGDLRKEMPQFSVDRLIGSNIDIFHKTPAHQQRMLAALQKQHRATIWIAGHGFDLIVNPLRDRDRTVGFVVEWSSAKTRLVNLDYSAQVAAISRSQAMIEFSIDGTIISANENFLRSVRYTMDQIKGRHHSIFLDPEQREDASYARFWDALRSGTYQAGRYKRLTRDGKTVWIEGAYNPINDESGKVCKVVKFANDVTAQVELFANLKRLIDHNFGEIDQAIGSSSNEADSAGMAAGEMSSTVQSLATSAEELAASIAEIAQSMTRSRTATEKAFAQTVSAGEDTDALARSTQEMNGIVGLIRSIASQINLLALNATIEAARAGDAGKGFAVVANEVKTLAIQAASATQRISDEIDGIQKISAGVTGALGTIRDGMVTVRESVMATASAVEEQNVVTRSMSEQMRNASGAVSSVFTSISGISSAVSHVAETVQKTKNAAQILVAN
ncbi:methyl-accepting chemotaxis protein [Acetobacteraceae bacterium KSS8]|uniref:Methyl-accepting chemotaxis protein n=1 Tax=Endosaccharibacter trunci TaxID=2812733 RepID=A0ABT1W7R9_9PROT|nr:methyl-accepting chemotaxis protein [Acetobacteraceae bacterium KSS8]